MKRTQWVVMAALAFGACLASPAIVQAHETGAMVVDIPYQMKLHDALLHGRYIIVHHMQEGGQKGPCTKVYDFGTKRLVTEFHCLHVRPTEPAPQNRVTAASVVPGVMEITSFQFKGSIDPIGVPGFQK